MLETDTDNAISKFEAETVQVLQRVRKCFAELIQAAPQEVMKGADLHRALNIDRKLSWMVFKVATAIDPLSVGPHVPRPSHLKTLFAAAAARGVDSVLIQAAQQAANEFEHVVKRHAGDRTTFDSMIAALVGDEDAEQIDLQQRRAAYRAQRHIFGVHARTHLSAIFVRPAANDSSMIDQATVKGHISLRRLRSNAPIRVSHERCTFDDGSVQSFPREPIDPQGQTPHGIALMPDFCTKPLPEFDVAAADHGFVHGDMISDGIGATAEITCITGSVARGAVPRHCDAQNLNALYCARVRIPCEVLIHDVLIQPGTLVDPPADARIYVEMAGEEPYPGYKRKGEWLTYPASAAYLGRGVNVLYSPAAPRYPELAASVFKRLGWNDEEFDVYRCRIEYPVLPSTTVIRFDLLPQT